VTGTSASVVEIAATVVATTSTAATTATTATAIPTTATTTTTITAAAVPTAATAEAAAAAAAAATTATTLRLTGFVDYDGTTAELASVELVDGGLGLGIGGDLDEGESTWAAGVPVGDDLDLGYLPNTPALKIRLD